MVESADTQDSGSCASDGVKVQLLSGAPFINSGFVLSFLFSSDLLPMFWLSVDRVKWTVVESKQNSAAEPVLDDEEGLTNEIKIYENAWSRQRLHHDR